MNFTETEVKQCTNLIRIQSVVLNRMSLILHGYSWQAIVVCFEMENNFYIPSKFDVPPVCEQN